MGKDWTGNSNSIFKTLGASSHTLNDRQGEDYYATEPKAAHLLLRLESFSNNIWECACGEGHLSKVFEDAGYIVKSTDLIDRGFGDNGIDFLGLEVQDWNGDIITNPPYKYAQEFIEKALQIIPIGNKVAMFLKLQFMEGKKRKHLFITHPPKVIYVSSSRLLCAKNGEFKKMIDGGGSAVAYGWFVWEKGFKGETVVKWFN
jgi:hypothetical protein